jgi:acyl-CoA dehydrogenase
MIEPDTFSDFVDADNNEALHALYDTTRRFTLNEIAPFAHQWDEAEAFPRELHHKAAALGLLGLGYPEALGGTPATWRMRALMSLALCRFGGSGGVLASLFTHNIGLPPVLAHGSEALIQRVVPSVLTGDKIAALAITEPGGGSDVANLKTSARLEGDEWVINGEKVFITSGLRADYLTVAVRTGDLSGDNPEAQKGARGISLIVVPGASEGLERTPLHKMGWWCSDTAQLRFHNVRVRRDNLVGDAGAGFKMIMANFNGERLTMSAGALGFALACFDEVLAWCQQRHTFGQALIERQVVVHKLIDMQTRIHGSLAWLWRVCDQRDARGENPAWVAEVCMLKNQSTQTMQFCADQAVQLMGAMGFMRGTVSERVYREVKVMMIGGGAEEIMKELAARQLGL